MFLTWFLLPFHFYRGYIPSRRHFSLSSLIIVHLVLTSCTRVFLVMCQFVFITLCQCSNIDSLLHYFLWNLWPNLYLIPLIHLLLSSYLLILAPLFVICLILFVLKMHNLCCLFWALMLGPLIIPVIVVVFIGHYIYKDRLVKHNGKLNASNFSATALKTKLHYALIGFFFLHRKNERKKIEIHLIH